MAVEFHYLVLLYTNDFGESPNSVFYFEKVNLQDGHCFFLTDIDYCHFQGC